MSDDLVIDGSTFENVIGQIGAVIATNRWMLGPPPANTKRGVDVYNANDFLSALLRSVVLFRHAHGYLPQFASPTTFNEHILARKFFAPLPMPSLGDKLGVRDYVRQRLGEEALIPVLWTGQRIDDLFTADLPAGRFVLKANHGCAMNLFLDLPQDLVTRGEEIRLTAEAWLGERFGYDQGEWQYSVIEPRLFLESFLTQPNGEPIVEVKTHCFHGKPRLIQVVTGRFTEHLGLGQYDADWTYMDAGIDGYEALKFDRPKNFGVLIECIERLAQGLEYVRIDLYTDFDRIVKFGEITLTPGDGRQSFSSLEFERWLGGFFTPTA